MKNDSAKALVGLGIIGAIGVWLGTRKRRPEETLKAKAVKISSPLPDIGREITTDDERSYWDIFDGVDKDVETRVLASVIASEAGTQRAEEQRAVAWAVRNRALKKKTPMSQWLKMGVPQAGQVASTARVVTNKESKFWKLAEVILDSPQKYDEVNGGFDFLEPALQDEIYNKWAASQRGNAPKTAEEIRERRKESGYTHKRSVGRWEFWG